MRYGDDLVLLLLQGLLDLGELRTSANRPVELGNRGAVGGKAVGEGITEVACAQDKRVLAGLDEVCGDNIPTQGPGA